MAHTLHLPQLSRRSPLLGFIILMHAAFVYLIATEIINVPIPQRDPILVPIAPEPVEPTPRPVDTRPTTPERSGIVLTPEAPPPLPFEEESDPIKVTEEPAMPIRDVTEFAGAHRVNPAFDPRHPIGKPEYPPQAIRMNQEGLVVVNACVQPNGRLTDLSVIKSSGFPVLDTAAIRHLSRPGTRFLPGTESGRPATICIDVPIRFSIEDR